MFVFNQNPINYNEAIDVEFEETHIDEKELVKERQERENPNEIPEVADSNN